MFDELEEYTHTGHFFVTPDSELAQVCNAPKDASGVYTVFALADGGIELVYIGISGKVQNNGTLKTSSGGLFDHIVNGTQFGHKRKTSWPAKMRSEQIEALDIYWYETFNADHQDIPAFIEGVLIQKHFDIFGKLPRWNEEY